MFNIRQIEQVRVLFTRLTLWVAVAGHSFKWMKIRIFKAGAQYVQLAAAHQLFCISIYIGNKLRPDAGLIFGQPRTSWSRFDAI